MRHWSLRSRLTILLGTVLSVFALLSAVAYLTSSREEDRLEASFIQELSFLSSLPAQRALVRQIDVSAEDYLLTRRPEWLQRRKAAIQEFRAYHARLAARLTHPPEIAAWALVGRAFDHYVDAQDDSLERARSGRMSRVEAVEMALTKDEVDALIESMTDFGRTGLQRMDSQRRAARRAGLATIAFLLGFGLLAALTLSAAVSRIVVAPILRLREHAGRWRLGEPWPSSPEDMPREVRELTDTMSRMAADLNAQYERERESSRLKSQLVSGVSHEFNNALSVIHTAHVLLQENDKSSDDAPWHEMLEANIRALSAMAKNLLNLGRLESGKFNVELQRVDLRPLLKGTLERLEVIAKRKSISTRLDVPADLPGVAADPEALTLVVANLLTNAFKYTPEKGRVTVKAAAKDGEVEVSVADTGIGIAPADREKIFSGYYRTEEGKRTAKGFGVGLALSRMVLEAHGADLSVDSEPGKGSRFFFTLPAWRV